MNKGERRRAGKPFCLKNLHTISLQTPHRRHLYFFDPLKIKAGRRVSLRGSRRGSLALESAMALPLLLCAVTALLYLFSFTSVQAKAYRTLSEQAQTLAVTAGQYSEKDPYIRLYDHQTAKLPFPDLFYGNRVSVQKAVARAWVGYTGESFAGMADEQMVYVTPEGKVYHRSRDCTYLNLSVKLLSVSGLEDARNQSGGRYYPCEYCVKSAVTAGNVYVTDHGASYHTSRDCQGLKRTVMAVPYSEAAGLPVCSRCGGAP